MPKTRDVESLSKTCLNSIANHLANYDPSIVLVANPFDKWRKSPLYIVSCLHIEIIKFLNPLTI